METLRIWSPAGECRNEEIGDRRDLIKALTDAANVFGCRVAELDYQIGDGIRIIGDSSAASLGIDYCGLPPSDPQHR